ncbi:MAG: hypothetical protein WC829_06900 [Hyphomicrobium sp.]|jgi:hypothetical protein
MNETNKGGRPKADPRAVSAWTRYRPLAIGELAAALGVSQPAVSKWVQVPEKRLDVVAQTLGVHPHLLRPDLAPPDPWSAL